MGSITDKFDQAFRDFVTDGVASSGRQEVDKSDARSIGPMIEAAIANAALGALVSVVYSTKAALDGDLAHGANSVGLVYADGTDANNDLYTKSGASGSGAWTNTGVFHSIFEALAQPYVDGAEAARDEAIAASRVATILTDGFGSVPLSETYTHGNTVEIVTSSGPTSGLIWADEPLPHSGILSAVTANMRQNGATDVYFARQNDNGDRIFEAKATFNAVAGTLTTYDLSGQAVEVKRDWYVGLKAGARVGVKPEPLSLWSPTAPLDNTPVTPVYVSNFPMFSVTVARDTNSDEGRVKDELDRVPLGKANAIYNVNTSNTKRSRAAIAAIHAGTALAFFASLFVFCGDSNTAGSHTGTDGLYLGAFDRNYVAQAAAALPELVRNDGLDLPVAYKGQAIMGLGNVQGTYPAYNGACTSEGDFSQTGIAPGYVSIGGEMWVSTTPGGAPIKFNIDATTDRLILGYPRQTTNGSIEYTLDGGATWTELSQAWEVGQAVDDYKLTTITFARGSVSSIWVRHKAATNTVYLHAFIAYDSTTPQLHWLNGGAAGSLASTTWGQVYLKPWSSITVLRNLDAAAKFLCLGTNDIAQGATLEDYLLYMRKLIRAAQAKSDVYVLCFPPLPIGTGNFTLERQQAFRAGLFALCDELNVPFIDTWAYLGSYDAALADGLMAGDVHLTFAGATGVALMLRDLFQLLA